MFAVKRMETAKFYRIVFTGPLQWNENDLSNETFQMAKAGPREHFSSTKLIYITLHLRVILYQTLNLRFFS